LDFLVLAFNFLSCKNRTWTDGVPIELAEHFPACGRKRCMLTSKTKNRHCAGTRKSNWSGFGHIEARYLEAVKRKVAKGFLGV
jgi:hypothetical protein